MTTSVLEELWLPAVAVVACNVLVFLLAQLKKDNSIVDIAWGMLFIIANTVVAYNNLDRWKASPRAVLMYMMVLVWGLRLSGYIGLRHKGEEDFRYKYLRNKWMASGTAAYYVKAFLYVFIMQALISLVVNSPPLFLMISASRERLGVLDLLGLAVFVGGLVMEALADKQMKEFRENPANKGQIMKGGLWRYTRHPNYFGETVLWWGVWLVACAQTGGWVTFIGPLTITLLLRFVSGVPPLERKFAGRPEFRQYKQETNVFLPWFPRRVRKVE